MYEYDHLWGHHNLVIFRLKPTLQCLPMAQLDVRESIQSWNYRFVPLLFRVNLPAHQSLPLQYEPDSLRQPNFLASRPSKISIRNCKLTSLEPTFPGESTYYILFGRRRSLNFSGISNALYGMWMSPIMRANYKNDCWSGKLCLMIWNWYHRLTSPN